MLQQASQEVFEEILKENLEIAENHAEAVKDTIEELKLQGLNTSNIVTDLVFNPETGNALLYEAIEELKKCLESKDKLKTHKLQHINTINDVCKKSLAHRVLATKKDANVVLLDVLIHELNNNADVDILQHCLQCMVNLTDTQPDIFTDQGLDAILKLLKSEDEQLQCLALEWLQNVCIKHEGNRQMIMKVNIVNELRSLLLTKNARIVSLVTAVFRCLILDDDIRVEFGCAHEHARKIANETYTDLIQLMKVHDDVDVLSDLLLTLGALTVRQEFCTVLQSTGGLIIVFEIMRTNPDHSRVNCEALKLLRALAGHDTVKMQMVKEGVADIIKDVLETHKSNVNVSAAALACISTVTLRVKSNSESFFEAGVPEIIVDVLQMHPNHKIIQRNGAWAIRNMVSRSREQCESWLSLGLEEILRTGIENHPTILQDIKAALRDLGCQVELKEEWKGVAEKKIAN